MGDSSLILLINADDISDEVSASIAVAFIVPDQLLSPGIVPILISPDVLLATDIYTVHFKCI